MGASPLGSTQSPPTLCPSPRPEDREGRARGPAEDLSADLVLHDLLSDLGVQVCSRHPIPAGPVGDSQLLPSELLHDLDLQPAPKNNSCVPWRPG